MSCSLCNGHKIVAPWERPDPIEHHKLSQRVSCPYCKPELYAAQVKEYKERMNPKVAGRTLEEWKTLARQDNCFDFMVPSDLREILSKVKL